MRVKVSREQMKAAFEAVKHDHSFDESRALWESAKPPAEMIQAMCLRPELLRAFGGFGDCVYPGGLLERRIKELVIIEASRVDSCQFCTASHVALVKLAGIEGDPMGAIENVEDLVPREQLSVEYTRAVMRSSNRIPEPLFQNLRSHFTEPEIVELTFLIGFINMLNMFNNALQVRYNDEYAGLM